jgi:hypothetical protein
MEYWSVGVMKKENPICFIPILQYSSTPILPVVLG